MDFFIEGSVLMDYQLGYNILARSDVLKLKRINDGFVSYKQQTFHSTIH